MSSGSNLRKAVEAEIPLQIVGTINAYCARLAERTGFKAIYLSGAGVANASFGLPDLGITTLNDVCEDTRLYLAIRNQETQKEVVDQMQTRAELYEVLNYHSFEDKLDQLFSIDRR